MKILLYFVGSVFKIAPAGVWFASWSVFSGIINSWLGASKACVLSKPWLCSFWFVFVVVSEVECSYATFFIFTSRNCPLTASEKSTSLLPKFDKKL